MGRGGFINSAVTVTSHQMKRIDVLAKVDFLEMVRNRVRLNALTDLTGCIGDASLALNGSNGFNSNNDIFARNGRFYEFVPVEDKLDFRNYVMATNMGIHVPLNAASWLEPTICTRITFTDFGSNAAIVGLQDRQVVPCLVAHPASLSPMTRSSTRISVRSRRAGSMRPNSTSSSRACKATVP